MTQADFQKIWEGNVLSARAPPHAWQVLTDREAQRITGSFFASLVSWFVKLIPFHKQIATILDRVATFIDDHVPQWLSPVSSLITTTLTSYSNILRGQHLKESFLNLAKVAVVAVLAVVNPVAFAIGLATSTVLLAAGVNQTISSLVSAFVSGGITGGLSAAGSATMTFAQAVGHGIASGIQSLAIQGTQMGLVKAGLDPALASIGSIGVGTIVGALTQGVKAPSAYDPVTHQPLPDSVAPWYTVAPPGLGAVGIALKTQLLPTLAGELAFSYGAQKLGAALGLDPATVSAITSPIRMGINPGINPKTGQARTTFEGIQQGLLQGAATVGVRFATQGLDPLIGNLASSTISGAIDGLLSPKDPNQPLGQRKGIFAGITETFTHAVGGFAEIGVIRPGDPAGNAQRLAQLNDFSTIIREKGLGAAVETYATSLLYRSSVESLLNAGYALDRNHAIKAAIEAQIQNPNNIVELDGRPAIQIDLGGRNYLWVDPSTHAFISTLQGQDYIQYMAPPKVDPKTGITGTPNAVIQRTNPDGSTVKQTLTGGELTGVEIASPTGIKMTFKPLPGQFSIRQKNAGEMSDASLEVSFSNDSSQDTAQRPLNIQWKDGKPIQGEITVLPELFRDPTEVIYNGVTAEQLYGSTLVFKAAPNETYQVEIKAPTKNIFGSTPYNVPFNTNSEDNGFDYKHDLNVQSSEGMRDIVKTLFSTHANYTPPSNPVLGAVADYFKRLATNTFTAVAKQGFAANIEGPKILKDLTASTYKELVSKIFESSNVAVTSRDKLLFSEIANKWESELSPQGTAIFSKSAKYDNVTINDVENLEVQSSLANIGSGVLTGSISTLVQRSGVALAIASVLDKSWDKVQVYDPTQRRYDVQVEYGKAGETNPEGWPRYSMWLKFRVGQDIGPDGKKGYEVVQATFQKAVRFSDGERWIVLPSETIRTHGGEDRGLGDPQ